MGQSIQVEIQYTHSVDVGHWFFIYLIFWTVLELFFNSGNELVNDALKCYIWDGYKNIRIIEVKLKIQFSSNRIPDVIDRCSYRNFRFNFLIFWQASVCLCASN